MGLRETVLAEVAHDEQMTIWTGEILGALSMEGHMNPDISYDEVIDAHSITANEVRRIIGQVVDVLIEASKEDPSSEGPAAVPPAANTGSSTI